jgi:hypothetical protein
MKAVTSSTRMLAGAVAIVTVVAAALPAQAAPLAASRAAPVVDAPIETVGYKQRRHYRSNNNRGAALAAGVAIGVLGLAAAAAAANSQPRYEYYEPVQAYPSYGYGYDYEPEYVYSRPVQYRYRNDPYDHRYYDRGSRYRQPPLYYNKEAAKQYWRQQKEIQKRAIKQGYYNQPRYGYQPGYGGPGYGSGRVYQGPNGRACTPQNPCYPNNPLDQIR